MGLHNLVSNTSFSMDGLCNFEPNRMYASVDMNQEVLLKAGIENADQIDKNDKKQENIQADDFRDLFHYGTKMEEANHEDENCIVMNINPHADRKNIARELEKVEAKMKEPSNCSKPTRKSRLSVSSSSSSKRIKLQQSPASTHAKSQSKNIMSEDESEDYEEEITSRLLTLADVKQTDNFLPGNIIMCINAGGASIPKTSVGGSAFLEDCHFSGGDVLRTDEIITNTQDPLIYQTARYGNFSYHIKDVPPGDCIVDLHFAEIIFTNGPPGLRVFDVLIQDHKAVAELDVYSLVGSDTPLIIRNIRASVKEKGLLISFQGIVGSPCLSAICIRKPESQETIQYVGRVNSTKFIDIKEISQQNEKIQGGKPKAESQQPQAQEYQKHKSKMKSYVQEYETKIQELKNEVHQAWLSVQHANRQNEKLQIELDCRSLHVDSLAQAVERQLTDLNEMKDETESEKQEWRIAMAQIFMKFQLLKKDFAKLAKEAHEWVSSFPAIQNMTEKVQALMDEHEELKKKFIKQGQDLRLYYNQVLELKGNIRVFCRCRPLNRAETSMGASSVVEFESTRDNEFIVRSNGTKKLFKFDRVFSPSHSQADVFLDTAPVVVSVLDGYNVCIFAYGQTGTGKTFTMEGTADDRGVNYRTLEELFELTAKRKGQFEYSISVSVVEVYNEQIRDLLAQPLPLGQSAKKLEIKHVAEGVHHVPGLSEATVNCMEEVWDVLQTGSSARAVGSTNANEHSSRSHCMLCVVVKGESLLTGECTRGKLWLVDLAGSERVAKTDVQGDRLKEAQNINKSLAALGDVIHALATKSGHVPYRNSKLTHLLQDSLGGESKTLMFVQISPSELDGGETLCSLNFASRVRGVELGPARKQFDSTDSIKHKQMLEKLKNDARVKDDSIRRLEDALKTKEQALQALSDKVKENEKGSSVSECRLKEQQLLIEKLSEELKAKEKQACKLIPDRTLTEQQSLIKKLREELKKTKEELSNCMPEQRTVEALQEIVNIDGNLNLLISEKTTTETMAEGKAELCPTTGTGQEVPYIAKFITTPVNSKVMASKCNIASPAAVKLIARKPGRVSVAGAHRKRASMATTYVPPTQLVQAVKLDAIDSRRSSSDSLVDMYPDENLLPELQSSAVPVPVLSSPRTVGWKKGTAIAPSTVLRRSIPRKIHFKSPHLQPNYLKGVMNGGPPPLPAGPSGHGGDGQNKRDQKGEINKMRRVSIATTRGRPLAPLPIHQQIVQPPWNATTTGLPASGAQRVPVANASKGVSVHNRERAWNR